MPAIDDSNPLDPLPPCHLLILDKAEPYAHFQCGEGRVDTRHVAPRGAAVVECINKNFRLEKFPNLARLHQELVIQAGRQAGFVHKVKMIVAQPDFGVEAVDDVRSSFC